MRGVYKMTMTPEDLAKLACVEKAFSELDKAGVKRLISDSVANDRKIGFSEAMAIAQPAQKAIQDLVNSGKCGNYKIGVILQDNGNLGAFAFGEKEDITINPQSFLFPPVSKTTTAKEK